MLEAPTPKPCSSQKPSVLSQGLSFIEQVGNKLPDPIALFFYLAVTTIIISAIASHANLYVVHPATQETLKVVSLLSPDGIRRLITDAVKNFIEFPPLGNVLIAMIGVGVAEYTGLISALLRQVVLIAPVKLISPIVVFIGVMSNIAAETGYVVIPPLAALVFIAFGRHPLAGIAAAFAGVAGGFSANLLIGTIDPLLAGITESAAKFIDVNYTINPACNYYFMAASTFLITLVGWFITDKIVEPRLTPYVVATESAKIEELNDAERKGLRWAGYSFLVFIIVLAMLVLPSQGILRDPITFTIIPSPFLNGLVPLIALLFLIPGIAYGFAVGTVKSDKDIAKAMGQAMSSLGYYIALAFVASQFIAYFSWTNIAVIVAVKGANLLKAIGFTGLPLLVAFILISSLINLFIGSTSAKWALIAPVFVPMLMLVGYSPEFTQMAYRIGDSTTNIITPLLFYFPLIVALIQKYDKTAGIGTLVALMLPYCVAFWVAWSLLFILWFMMEIPLGPGISIHFESL